MELKNSFVLTQNIFEIHTLLFLEYTFFCEFFEDQQSTQSVLINYYGMDSSLSFLMGHFLTDIFLYYSWLPSGLINKKKLPLLFQKTRQFWGFSNMWDDPFHYRQRYLLGSQFNLDTIKKMKSRILTMISITTSRSL